MTFTVRVQAHLDRGTPEEVTGEINELLAKAGPSGMPAMFFAAPARALLAARRRRPRPVGIARVPHGHRRHHA